MCCDTTFNETGIQENKISMVSCLHSYFSDSCEFMFDFPEFDAHSEDDKIALPLEGITISDVIESYGL